MCSINIVQCTIPPIEINCTKDCDVNAHCVQHDDEDEDQCVCKPGYIGDGYTCLSKIFYYYLVHVHDIETLSVSKQKCKHFVQQNCHLYTSDTHLCSRRS